MTNERPSTRKGNTPINVWVTPDEKARIEQLAKQTGHSMSSLLRSLGMGHMPPSILDHRSVLELAKINADQGRLGGLLKMWLTNKERFAGIEEQQMRLTIGAVLSRIEEMQHALLQLAEKIDGDGDGNFSG